jgi:anthranilate/para-aminobenzoate synthase component I
MKALKGARLAAVQAYLRSGDCYQVNLAQRFQARYVGNEWQAFRQLIAVTAAQIGLHLTKFLAVLLAAHI